MRVYVFNKCKARRRERMSATSSRDSTSISLEVIAHPPSPPSFFPLSPISGRGKNKTHLYSRSVYTSLTLALLLLLLPLPPSNFPPKSTVLASVVIRDERCSARNRP